MRSFILIIIFTITTLSAAYSQKIRIGITAGPTISGSTRENIQIKNSTDSSKDHTRSVSSVLSFFGGFVASVPLSKNIIFRPQLQFIQKGWKNHFDFDNSQDYDARIRAECIDLPLNFVYNVPTKNGRFFIGAGPYLSLALSGNAHNELDNTDTKITFKSADTSGFSANRFDIGANVIAGYEFRNGFFVSLNYSHGFIDFRTELKNATNPSNKNTVVGLGIGYMFK
ncbi:MAG: porin family protein [Ginsengibacter sp.]